MFLTLSEGQVTVCGDLECVIFYDNVQDAHKGSNLFEAGIYISNTSSCVM